MAENHIDISTEQKIYRLTEFFRALGDPTRIKVIFLITSQEICVSDIANRLAVSESAVSHHLQVLKMSGLVKRKRDGKSMLYSLADDHVRIILQQTMEHTIEMRKV